MDRQYLANSKVAACNIVALNWRIRKRLPRITRLAVELGIVKD